MHPWPSLPYIKKEKCPQGQSPLFLHVKWDVAIGRETREITLAITGVVDT